LRSRILSDAGYEVLEAGTGTEALALAKAQKPALILLDINLPDLSGVDVCERLKRDPATSAIPVIQITGAWISEEARQRGLASGASAYLVEPVDEVLLLKTVVGLIESQT
jgi:CheY-like chemotaxis protein